MLRIRPTEKTVAKLAAPTAQGRPVIYWDAGPRAVRGFGVLCSGKTDTRSYVAQRDLPGGRTRRVTIAGVNELSLDEARARAADLLVDIRRGNDPKARQKSLTLARCWRPTVMHARMRCVREATPHTATRWKNISATGLNARCTRSPAIWSRRPPAHCCRNRGRQRENASASAQRHEDRAARAEARGWCDAATRHRAEPPPRNSAPPSPAAPRRTVPCDAAVALELRHRP